MTNKQLGTILKEQGKINQHQLDFCLSVQRNNGNQRLGDLLTHYHFTNEISVYLALANQIGWGFYQGEYIADLEVLNQLGMDFFEKNQVYPLKVNESCVFVLARYDDTQLTDLINQKLGYQAKFNLGLSKDIQDALIHLKQSSNHQVSIRISVEDSLNQWVGDCLNKALELKASDIHLEPSHKAIEIRFRIDGVLVFIESLPLNLLSRLVNIFFHMAEVTISDFNHFHDAKFVHSYQDRHVDIRLSHIPTIQGSALVLRLLDKNKNVTNLSDLGYSPQAMEDINKGIRKPEGICLLVGPTGCGKTTTLYAILNQLKSIELKILTIEDPVEIELPLLNQVQINDKRQIGFPQSVRAFLRHDPDVILIGEIRDEHTAAEALRAAMTGHQVFSTLHTNRAIDVFFRLNDLCLPFVYMADHIKMIVAQRLVRKLCVHCKKKVEQSADVCFKAVGCELCNQGYKGQTVIAEVLLMNEQLSDLLSAADIGGLKKYYKASKHHQMKDDATSLIRAGITSQEEIERVLG